MDQGQASNPEEEKLNGGRFSLSAANKVPYSRSELALFRHVPKDGSKISSARLTELKKRSDRRWSVEHPRHNVTVTMRHLMHKVRQNREGFVIVQSPRRGPHAVEYWIKETR